MNNAVTFIVEPDTGKVTVEVSGVSSVDVRQLETVIGKGTPVNCGRPVQAAFTRSSPKAVEDDAFSIWLYDLYHNSVVDGPGRRSVIQVAGCSLRCPGFIYSLEGAKYDLAHERQQQRTAYF